jgi:hypothetical protein
MIADMRRFLNVLVMTFVIGNTYSDAYVSPD